MILWLNAMVDTRFTHALDTIQGKIVPYNSEWNTGIAYDFLNRKIRVYLRKELCVIGICWQL